MKSERLMWIAGLAVFAGMTCTVQLAAQDKQSHKNARHHHYQLIDIGTFGGPQSFTQEELKFLNSQGTVAGTADTPTLDPNYPNSCVFCGPYIDHAFLWKNGSLTDLGALPGLNTSGAFGISNSGLSAGFSENGEIDPLLGLPEVRAVRWKEGEILDLGTLEGGYESAAFQVNSRGQVAGVSFTNIPDQFTGVQERTFLWDAQNGMQDLGTLGTGTDAGLLGFKGNVEINERGQVAGCSFTNRTVNPVTGAPTLDPFLWDKEKAMQDLGTLGGTSGCPLNLNNHGQVVGYSNVAGDLTLHPFIWSAPGPMRDLGTLGGTFGYAVWANEAGEVVGTSTIQGDDAVHGFLWKRGKLIDLGVLDSLPNSSAEWINSHEQIVGNAHSSDGSTFLAVLWENSGPAVDLNTLIASGSDLLLTIAHNINDRGEIGVGGVTSDGNNHAVLLIPCDEHHPRIEGCDYSMVEAGPPASVQPSVRPTRRSMLPSALWQRNNRFRFPGRNN